MKGPVMSTIRVARPRRQWAVTPATVLPTALLVRLFRPHWNYTVVLDHVAAGKLGEDQVRVLDVEPGEHRLFVRFVLLRRSRELQVTLREGEERQFICGTSAFGWPTLREASSEDVAHLGEASFGEPSEPGDPASG